MLRMRPPSEGATSEGGGQQNCFEEDSMKLHEAPPRGLAVHFRAHRTTPL
jgi:hypothetical protein